MKAMRDESERAARRIAAANAGFEPRPGEQAAAWARLQAHWDGLPDPRVPRQARHAGLRLMLGAGALAALGALAWWVFPGRPAGDARPRVTAQATPTVLERAAGGGESAAGAAATAEPSAASGATSPSEEPSAPASERPAAPVAMRPGRSVLAEGVSARLAPRGAATVRHRAGAQPSVVALQQGTLELAIVDAKSARGGARWEVQVTTYRIAAADQGRFSVRARGGRVDVLVKSGMATVWSSRRLLATVVAGQRWTNVGADGAASAAIAPPAEREQPATEPAPALAEAPDCTRLTRQGAIDPALACFAHQSSQPGLTGELALIELARIRRDVKGDLAGAEQALAEHHRRFPHGALAAEATGSRVELLLRLGRASEALDESEHLTGGEAIFWRATCLAKLGRKTEAAQAFDDYLARPEGKRRSEAKRMREELAPQIP